MTVYAARQRRPEQDFFATITTTNGGVAWEHVRTNLGPKVAYAMIAKHWDGHGKITDFRHDHRATREDKEAARDSDGILRENIWAGYGEMATYY